MKARNPADNVWFSEADMFVKPLFEHIKAGLAWGEKLMFSLVTLEPGGEVPTHSHPHEQAGICLEGEFELEVGGARRVIRPHEMYIIPPETPHAARALKVACKTLDIFAPPRDEYKT